ncbi:hypothetical protein ABKN59_011343 [Abortiporus biennis]
MIPWKMATLDSWTLFIVEGFFSAHSCRSRNFLSNTCICPLPADEGHTEQRVKTSSSDLPTNLFGQRRINVSLSRVFTVHDRFPHPTLKYSALFQYHRDSSRSYAEIKHKLSSWSVLLTCTNPSAVPHFVARRCRYSPHLGLNVYPGHSITHPLTRLSSRKKSLTVQLLVGVYPTVNPHLTLRRQNTIQQRIRADWPTLSNKDAVRSRIRPTIVWTFVGSDGAGLAIRILYNKDMILGFGIDALETQAFRGRDEVFTCTFLETFLLCIGSEYIPTLMKTSCELSIRLLRERVDSYFNLVTWFSVCVHDDISALYGDG